MIEESGNEVGAVLTMYEYCVSIPWPSSHVGSCEDDVILGGRDG